MTIARLLGCYAGCAVLVLNTMCGLARVSLNADGYCMLLCVYLHCGI